MRSYIKALVYGAVLGLIITAPSSAKQTTIPTISTAQASTCELGFDQSAPTLADAQAYEYKAVVDSAPASIITAVCSGATSPFLCKTPLPAKTVGTHTVALSSAEILSDGTRLPSPLSVVYTYRVANPPATPVNLRIILVSGGN